MRSTHVFTFGLAASVVLLAAGCSNNSEAIKLPVQPTAAETSAAPTTSLALSITSLPTTTTAPTAATEAPTTAPPTTIDIETQIRADLQRATQAFVDCQITPETCDFAAYAIPGSPVDLRARQVISDFLSSNLRSKAGFGTYVRTATSVTNVGSNASVKVCDEDSIVLFDIQTPANPDDDIVFNDGVATKEHIVSLRLLEGRWGIWEIKQTSRVAGELSCAGRS